MSTEQFKSNSTIVDISIMLPKSINSERALDTILTELRSERFAGVLLATGSVRQSVPATKNYRPMLDIIDEDEDKL